MARRRRGVPHVMAYWWKSPSSARWAASTSTSGGRKFGMPWARLMPPCWLFTRVISRMTDSVNPCTRFEIIPQALPAAGDGGDDGDLVGAPEGGLEPVQEAHVLLVHVHVDEPPDLAGAVEHPVADAGVLALEVRDDARHRVALGVDLGGPLRDGAERSGNTHEHGHVLLPAGAPASRSAARARARPRTSIARATPVSTPGPRHAICSSTIRSGGSQRGRPPGRAGAEGA